MQFHLRYVRYRTSVLIGALYKWVIESDHIGRQIMKLTVLAAAAIVGGTLGFLAPAPANATLMTAAPIDITETASVQ